MGWKSRVAKQTKNIRTIAHWEKKAQTQKRIVLFQTQNLSHGLQLCAATTEQHCVELFFEEKNCRQHQTTAMMMAQKHHHVILNELGGRDNLKNYTWSTTTAARRGQWWFNIVWIWITARQVIFLNIYFYCALSSDSLALSTLFIVLKIKQ